MKFEDLKNSFKNGFKSAYHVVGVDEFLITSSINLIIKYSKLDFQDLNLVKFSEGVIDCSEVVRAADTMPVFSDKKIVILDIRMSRKSELKNVKELNEYLKSPNQSTILIINQGSNEDDFGIDKKLVEMVDCNRLDTKIVEAKIASIFRAKNKVIDAKAMTLLMEYCLCDLAKIIIECDKIIAYVGDRDSVTSSDIQEIVTRSIEYKIFELTENLAKKDSSKVYAILGDLQAKKDEYKMLPALIYAHFRRLFHVALNQNLSNLEISKMLGVKEYAIKMTQSQIKLFSKAGLKKINEMCAQIDYDLKQSNISLENAIELIVLFIINI